MANFIACNPVADSLVLLSTVLAVHKTVVVTSVAVPKTRYTTSHI